jgi:hypothetical protein
MIARAVHDWYQIPRAKIAFSLLCAAFREETGYTISNSWFRKLSHVFATERTIRTGAADCHLADLPEIFVERAFYRIVAQNTIAVDEKPWLLRKIAPKSFLVGKDVAIGPIYKPLHTMLKGSPVYMICAVAVSGVLLYALSDVPFVIDTFNAFLLRLIELIPRDRQRRWLLVDNASFHAIDEMVAEELGQASMGVTHTAPSTCCLDPIEEFFAHCVQIMQRRYEIAVVQTGHFVPVNRAQFKDMIKASVDEAGAADLTPLFARAGLVNAPGF